jgi:hypothetical protein
LGKDFYQQFISLVDTNGFTRPLWALPTLIDTNNSGIKVTNTVLDLGNLKQGGEISGVRLGMTMQAVVDRWGKPQGGWSRCMHGLITFFYNGVSLGFEGNRLETICLFPSGRFAGGLSSDSQAKEFVQVLGPPTERKMSGNNCSLVYLSPGGNLRLDFHEEELVDIYLERTPSRAQPWNQLTKEPSSSSTMLPPGSKPVAVSDGSNTWFLGATTINGTNVSSTNVTVGVRTREASK